MDVLCFVFTLCCRGCRHHSKSCCFCLNDCCWYCFCLIFFPFKFASAPVCIQLYANTTIFWLLRYYASYINSLLWLECLFFPVFLPFAIEPDFQTLHFIWCIWSRYILDIQLIFLFCILFTSRYCCDFFSSPLFYFFFIMFYMLLLLFFCYAFIFWCVVLACFFLLLHTFNTLHLFIFTRSSGWCSLHSVSVWCVSYCVLHTKTANRSVRQNAYIYITSFFRLLCILWLPFAFANIL